MSGHHQWPDREGTYSERVRSGQTRASRRKLRARCSCQSRCRRSRALSEMRRRWELLGNVQRVSKRVRVVRLCPRDAYKQNWISFRSLEPASTHASFGAAQDLLGPLPAKSAVEDWRAQPEIGARSFLFTKASIAPDARMYQADAWKGLPTSLAFFFTDDDGRFKAAEARSSVALSVSSSISLATSSGVHIEFELLIGQRFSSLY